MSSQSVQRGAHALVLLVLTALGLPPSHASAQVLDPAPADWGDIPEALVDLDAHPTDENATAIIVSDVGETEMQRSGKLILSRATRVKILTKAGVEEHGTVEIPLHPFESVRDIDAHTVVRRPDGTIQRTELKKDDVYEEELTEERRSVVFTMPGLQPGAVIEYRYEVLSDDVLSLPSWDFQSSAPTVYSSYAVQVPPGIHHTYDVQGDPSFVVDQEDTVLGAFGREAKRHWVVENVPALRPEPFISSVENVRQRVRFQIRGISLGDYEPILPSWDALADELLNHDMFGKQLERYDSVEEATQKAVAGAETDAEKIEAVHAFLTESVGWDGTERVFAEEDLDDVLARASGSRAEINLLFCSMLRLSGVTAHPVLIGTRSYGRPSSMMPFVRQFNSVVVAAKDDMDYRFVDATDPFLSSDLIPEETLNLTGWVVHENERWSQVRPPGMDARTSLVRATLSPDGTMTASVQVQHRAYAAAASRRAIADQRPDEWLTGTVLAPGATVTDVSVEGDDAPSAPLTAKASTTIPAYAQVSGDRMYVHPRLTDRTEKNPFSAKERRLTIDFPYPETETYTLTMALPEGYEVDALPENKAVRLGQNDAVFQRITSATPAGISMQIRFIRRALRFDPSVYDRLRSFYQEMIDMQNEPIVLRRTDAAPEDAAADPTPAGDASSH
ncbi:MAG: DUF3857 domain-containing protein [Bacteroidetes bacterium]|jgi:hypothetical protein|nr:DUF3857 domain-containing protein [Bacteroidota bacterium]